MATQDLPDELVEAGRAALDAADQIGLFPQGAAWIYDHGLGEWRYVLVSVLVVSIGRRRVYGLLAKAFRKMDLPENLTIVDVHLESPNSPLYSTVRNTVITEDGMMRFVDCVIDGLLFDGLIYRWGVTPSVKTIKNTEREFLKKAKALTTD